MKQLRKNYNDFSIWLYFKLREEEGIGSIELVLILVALIALVIIFKEQLTGILNNFAGKIEGQAEELFN